MSPIGYFKCFLRWKGKLYRIHVEVMKDSANVLSREITFLMGILKMQLNVEKVPIEQTSTVDPDPHPALPLFPHIVLKWVTISKR